MTRSTISRRRFVQGALAAAALGAVGCTDGGERGSVGPRRRGDDAVPQASGLSEPIGSLTPGAVDGRVLVVVDLQGGNDGLSTLVPYGSGLYYDLRPQLAVDPEEVLALDDEVGLHPSLARLHERAVMTVEGVGPVEGDLSHFAMTKRWERGDVGGSETQLRTGFLGRLADAVDDGSPLVGLSIGSPTSHFVNQRAATIALSSPDELWFLSGESWSEPLAYQAQLRRFGGAYVDLLDLAEAVVDEDEDEDVDWEHPMLTDGGELGWKLYLAGDLLAADVGTRVVYIGAEGYDTHSGHAYRQAANLTELDAAVDGFLARAADDGIDDRVLVATISEFGRRVPENENGLDHGSASTMLLAGPVPHVRAGERPPLDDLDEDENLRTTIGFDRYLATLAEEWLGVEAASVLPGEPEPLGLLVDT